MSSGPADSAACTLCGAGPEARSAQINQLSQRRDEAYQSANKISNLCTFLGIVLVMVPIVVGLWLHIVCVQSRSEIRNQMDREENQWVTQRNPLATVHPAAWKAADEFRVQRDQSFYNMVDAVDIIVAVPLIGVGLWMLFSAARRKRASSREL